MLCPTCLIGNLSIGGELPVDQVLSIRNLSLGVLDWQIEEDCGWLEVSVLSGQSTNQGQDVVLSVGDLSGMEAGLYEDELIVYSDGSMNTPQVVSVSLHIRDALHVPGTYGSIQAAINAAFDGEVVIVAPGIYIENIDFLGKNIIVTSSDPEDAEVVSETIIDGGGNGSVVKFENGESREAVLTGFTILGGSGSYNSDMEGIYWGGGVYCSDSAAPIFINCVFQNNETPFENAGSTITSGGGVLLHGSSPQREPQTLCRSLPRS